MTRILALTVLLALLPSLALAGGEERLGDIARARAEIDALPAPERFAALRRLFGAWDEGDPAEVEEAVRSVADAQAQPEAVRAYARVLDAYAHRRRGDLAGARAIVAQLGFVRTFAFVGPFDNEGKVGLGRTYEPEVEDQPAPQKQYDGKERKVGWRTAPLEAPFGWIDGSALVRPTQNICVYASSWVRDPSLKSGQSRAITLFAGSAGALRVWFDGALALEDAKYRSYDADRLARNVTLRDGWNRVLVKACGDEGAPIFSVRIGDARGAPLKLEARAQVTDAPSRKPGALPLQTIAGPLEMLERGAKSNAPAALEALARYLLETGADDPTEHRARDLAARAADAAPTIPRSLLAAQLAEDRNQAAARITKAESLVGAQTSARDRVRVLLARAAHVRASPNWRDAVPYYDRALALDADEPSAIVAKVDVYQEAGLQHTAVAALEKAIARRPRSFVLLRELAGALRQVERVTEAEEVEERAAMVRFDDEGWLRGRFELAVARRDRTAADRWLERIVSLDPDGAERALFAARGYVRLGERAKAIALFKHALDLAPEDTDTMRALADVHAIAGQQSEQVALLRKVLELRPQSKDVRDYLAQLQPRGARPDEAYARAPEEFLKLQNRPSQGQARRTLVSETIATVFPNGLASHFNQVVFQPLTDRAAVEDRVYSFGYEGDSQVVQVRGARVYHRDGTVEDAVEMGESGAAEDPSISMYTSQRVYSVRMPRLSAGDVVDIRYRVEDISLHNAFADYFGDVAYLESRDDTARAEYVLIGPKSRAFYFNEPKLIGGASVEKTTEERGDQRVYRFLAKDVRGVEPEPLQPPASELFGHVHVSTYKTWEEVGRWYWGLVKDQFNADDEVRRRAQEITKGLPDERAKVRAVYDFVVQKTRYVALEFGIHGFKPYACSQIFARGFGDCKDKATLIVTMLKEVGIPATIVIVRTGLRGSFEESPASLAPFDHAIAYVPSLDWYLDGTAEYTGASELPAMDRGAMAMQINEGNTKLVHLPDPPASESKTSRKIDAQLAADGSAVVEFQADVTGVGAPSWRVRYHAEDTRKQRLLEDLSGDLPSLTIDKVESGKLDDVEAPVAIKVKGKVGSLARAEGGGVSVAAGPREHFVRDYAPASTRKLTARLGPRSTQVTEWTLRLPPGAKITSAPKAAKETSAFGSYEVQVEQSGTMIKVTTTVVMDRARVAPAEYPAFRAFCESIDRVLGQRVVYSK